MMIRKRINTGTPGWRPLAGVSALVLLVHALVLQASPAQLGAMPDADDAGAKVLNIRTIEAPPALPTQPTAAQSTTTAQKAQKNLSNKPIVQQIRVEAAPEIIAPIASIESQATAQVTPSPIETAPVVAAAPPAEAKKTAVTAVSLPASARLQYKVMGLSKSLNYQASAELSWKTNGDTYDAAMKVSAFLIGARSMTSVGKITGSGLAPIRFSDKFRSEQAAHFEAEKGKITFSANTPDAAWVEGAQDRVSVFFQLAGILAAQPKNYPAGTLITFLTIGPRDADTWTFVIEGEETLNLMATPIAALKLTRKPRKEFDQQVEIWFAPSLGYLPVRSRITQQSGDFIDQQLTGVVR